MSPDSIRRLAIDYPLRIHELLYRIFDRFTIWIGEHLWIRWIVQNGAWTLIRSAAYRAAHPRLPRLGLKHTELVGDRVVVDVHLLATTGKAALLGLDGIGPLQTANQLN